MHQYDYSNEFVQMHSDAFVVRTNL